MSALERETLRIPGTVQAEQTIGTLPPHLPTAKEMCLSAQGGMYYISSDPPRMINALTPWNLVDDGFSPLLKVSFVNSLKTEKDFTGGKYCFTF